MWNTDIFEAAVQGTGGASGKVGCKLGATLELVPFARYKSLEPTRNPLLEQCLALISA